MEDSDSDSDSDLYKDYICTYHRCWKGFVTQKQLDVHKKIHEKPFKCKGQKRRFILCEAQFDAQWKLNKHMKTHTKPHECEFCHKGFSTATNLKRHRVHHTGEAIYGPCYVCKRKMFRESDIINYSDWGKYLILKEKEKGNMNPLGGKLVCFTCAGRFAAMLREVQAQDVSSTSSNPDLGSNPQSPSPSTSSDIAQESHSAASEPSKKKKVSPAHENQCPVGPSSSSSSSSITSSSSSTATTCEPLKKRKGTTHQNRPSVAPSAYSSSTSSSTFSSTTTSSSSSSSSSTTSSSESSKKKKETTHQNQPSFGPSSSSSKIQPQSETPVRRYQDIITKISNRIQSILSNADAPSSTGTLPSSTKASRTTRIRDKGKPSYVPPKCRVKFTKEEEDNLIKGVREFGPGKWRKILNKFEFHESRTNISLKDKYRTLSKQGAKSLDIL